jgi:hypothetical protein
MEGRKFVELRLTVSPRISISVFFFQVDFFRIAECGADVRSRDIRGGTLLNSANRMGLDTGWAVSGWGGGSAEGHDGPTHCRL